ncbi:MAG: GH116 family glycosyl hydrolase [Limisphaerales bacterium]
MPRTYNRTKAAVIPRRDFLKYTTTAIGSVGLFGATGLNDSAIAAENSGKSEHQRLLRRTFNGEYSGEYLNRVAFPMGGIGAGMICLEGTGALSHFSIRNRPAIFNEPCIFAAICIKTGQNNNIARVLEGPVPRWKLFGMPGTGNGAGGTTYGLPRFKNASFLARFPFGVVKITDNTIPLNVEITGWSPFEPLNPDNSSLPLVGLEYKFTNKSKKQVDAIFSFNSKNFMAIGQNPQAIKPVKGGFILWSGAPKERPWEEGSFAVFTDEADTKVNYSWFRGGWWDALTIAWKDIEEGRIAEKPPIQEGGASPGASLFVSFKLPPGETKTITLKIAWYVKDSNIREGRDLPGIPETPGIPRYYRPWYSTRFSDINQLCEWWRINYSRLRENSKKFSDCFYSSTLPPKVIEAVAANLTILKSPTVLRQHDGRLWCWEGCGDNSGCCAGSCTHVWNYAQAIAHLFPSLERTLRETEFNESQDLRGHQTFRSALPIRPVAHDFHAAADGQLGGIMKVYREWRISGNTEWLRSIWDKVKTSLNYCINEWDPGKKGWVEEPHHNTYDIEFWGPDGMCTSFYLGALQAAILMGKALGEDVSEYEKLFEKGVKLMESELFNGEYFIQKIEWKNLRAKNPLEVKSFGGGYSPEALELMEKEGPKYQYGTGCLADGVLGCWLALVCGVGNFIDREKVKSHLISVYKYNLKKDLSEHSNPQRPSYACGNEGGLLLCTWPKGGMLSLPFVYSNEVWTGIEYQVASHLFLMGMVKEGLDIVRTCRERYDGRTRNPFNEYECGHWYGRALSSYALLQGLSGARYDAIEKVLYLEPSIKGDFQSFICTATGYGLVGVKKGRPFLDVKSGNIECKEIRYVKQSR